MSGKYALIIGNAEYTDPGLAQLTAPGKDAKDFWRVLNSPDIGAFDDVIMLFNENSNKVSEAIDYFFSLKKPDDLLLLYFSGHGVRDEYGSLYLAVKNTSRARLRSTAIKSDFIREAMDQSRSKRQVLILDCCNSGAFAQGTKAETGGSVGTASAFEGTGYGRVVLTASDSTQFAWEGDKVIGETQNSLFTHFLVKGLDGEADHDGDGKITIDELYDYAYEQIVNITPKQTPGKWSYKQQGEIILRQSTRIENIKSVPLSEELISEIKDLRPYVREAAVQQLAKLLHGKNLGLAHSAREALEHIEKEDDSRRVSEAATQAMESVRQAEQVAFQKAEGERLAAEKLDAEHKTKEEAERVVDQVVTDLDFTKNPSLKSLDKGEFESVLPKTGWTTTSSQQLSVSPKSRILPKWVGVAIAIGFISALILCSILLSSALPSMRNVFPIETTYTQTLTSTSRPKPTALIQPTATYTSSPTIIACFKLLTPENGANLAATGKITFAWEVMPGAVSYNLEITAPNGVVISFENENPSNKRFAESVPAAGKYQWSVTAYDADGEILCSTDSFSFTKPETFIAKPTNKPGNSGGPNPTPGGPTPPPTLTATP